MDDKHFERQVETLGALDDPVRRQWVNLVQGLLLSNEFVFVE